MTPEEAALRTLARLPKVKPTDEQIVALRALLNPQNDTQMQRKAA